MKAKTKNIYIMYAIALLQGMVFYGPIATLYRQAKGVSVFQITLIESISLALCLLLEFPWGILADKIGYKRTILICNILYFLSKIVFWQAEGFPSFLLERIMLSVIIAGLSGVDTALLYLSCNGQGKQDAGLKNSQQVFGIYNSLQTAGLLAAAFLFSFIIKDNYELAAFLTVISYGVAALLTCALAETAPPQAGRPAHGFLLLIKNTLADKHLLLFLIGVALLNETHQTITVFLNQLQYVKCGLSPSAIGYIYILVTIFGLCGIFSYRITKKIGSTRTAALLFSIAAIACILLAFTSHAFLSVLAILALRVAHSLFQPLQEELQNRQITAADRATALSINAVIIDSIGVATNIAFGSLAQYSLPLSLLFGATLCVLGIFLLKYAIFRWRF